MLHRVVAGLNETACQVPLLRACFPVFSLVIKASGEGCGNSLSHIRVSKNCDLLLLGTLSLDPQKAGSRVSELPLLLP